MKAVSLSVWVVVVGAAAVLAEHAHTPPVVERAEAPAADNHNSSLNIVGRPVDCADYLMGGATASGVYEIYPFSCTCGRSVRVWCDMETDGGGWTVFLKRQNQTSQLDFNRTWTEYKEGFGSPEQEHWLGNELLHQMTFSREYAVRLDVHLTSGGYDYGTYERFKIDDEDTRYRTTLSGKYDGGETRLCMYYLNGRYFTTRDRDYDSYGGNCAAKQGGGWWYYDCRRFNPTSTYNSSSINMLCYSSSYTQKVTSIELKLRPAICDSAIKTIHLQDLSCGCQDTPELTTK